MNREGFLTAVFSELFRILIFMQVDEKLSNFYEVDEKLEIFLSSLQVSASCHVLVIFVPQLPIQTVHTLLEDFGSVVDP